MPFVTCAGHSLEYEWLGAAGAGRPTLVFLHEGLGSIRQWRDFPAQLAAATGCRALVYSRYGCGNSDVVAESRRGIRYMHEEALESLPQLLAELRVERPVLIGHSDGASIAVIHAGAGYPVRALVLIAPHVFVERVGLQSIEKARQAFAQTDLPERLGKYHRDPRRTFFMWNDVWLDAEFAQWTIEEYLPGVGCPVMAIQGEDDEYGTMEQLDRVRRGVRGACVLVKLPACGHRVHVDQPMAAVAAITRFVDEYRI